MSMVTNTESRKSTEFQLHHSNEFKVWIVRHLEMIAVVLSGLLIICGWLTSTLGWPAVSAVLYLASFMIGGYAKAKEGIEELIEHKVLNVNILMILAAVGSAAIGYWTEGAILIFIFALSGALETYVTNKSMLEVSKLMALQPEEARLYENGQERMVPVQALRVGQTVVIKPGDRIPVDGTVTEGSTTVNQAAITGESVPAEKHPGDAVLAGTVNVQGAILVQVDKPNEETLFQKMIQLIQRAQQDKPRQQQFIERFEQRYVIIVLVAVLAVIVLSPLIFSWTWAEAVYRGMVLLVVASPCALVASTMPALLSAMSNGAKRGVLFKGGTHVLHLQDIRVVALDKTGTLTRGLPEVKEVVAFNGLTEEEVLRWSASVEQFSTHPLAEAIVRKANELSIELNRPQDIQAVTGFGVQAKSRGSVWKVGKRQWIDAPIDEQAASCLSRFAANGQTVVCLQRDDQLVGLLALEDMIRPQAEQVISQLKKHGIHTVMLTGDNPETARSIARQAGVDDYYANCLPDDKVAQIRKLKAKYGSVAMIGDGVNDAPALAVASVGIGMGAGTDAALETADVILVQNDLRTVPFVLGLAQRTERIMKQNIVFSLAVILVLIAANFTQSINLPLGVIGHEGSTILVILNGLRLLVQK